MIFVNRNKINPPRVLTEQGEGEQETIKATIFFLDSTNQTKSFPFKVYKDETIKVVFNELFNKKCAYCESNYARVQPVDVEHYRPKGAVSVDGKLKKPGYYWLGSDWNNLLPSCIDCNRQRTHEIDDQETELLGKANLFPIRNEDMRATKPGYEFYEKRLLLHPCLDKPEEHIVFNLDGTVKGLSFMGIVSIDTYGLMRRDLVDAREGMAKDIISKISLIKWLLGRIDSLSERLTPSEVEDFYDRLTTELKLLVGYMDNKREYSALARSIIEPFLEEYENILNHN